MGENIVPSDEEICTLCQQTYLWHKMHSPRHAFQREGEAEFKEEPPFGTGGIVEGATPPPPRPQFPSDPVLRQALINKGILTVKDLEEAEEHIQVISAGFAASVNASKAAHPSSPGSNGTTTAGDPFAGFNLGVIDGGKDDTKKKTKPVGDGGGDGRGGRRDTPPGTAKSRANSGASGRPRSVRPSPPDR